MEKIKKYNQILLALAGTIGVLFLAGAAIVALFEVSKHWFRNNNNNQSGVKIEIPTDTISNSAMDALKFQEISYLAPVQLDSGIDEYLIPIGQVNLEKPEALSDPIPSEGEPISLSNPRLYKKSYYNRSYGIYNNFIIHKHKRESQTKVFDQKVSITSWSQFEVNNTKLILFKGTANDNNKDGYLNEEDLQQLWVYYRNTGKLIDLNIENGNLSSFDYMPETNSIYLRVGMDLNQNGKYNSITEPIHLFQFNIETKELNKMVNENLHNELQSLIQ